LTLDAVPAWVCQQCGEVYFDEPEVDSIQEIIRVVEDRAKKLSVAAQMISADRLRALL